MGVGIALVDGKKEAQLDSYYLSPTNISAVGVPTGGELPGIPFSSENNTDPPRRGGVNPEVDWGDWRGFGQGGAAKIGCELGMPPVYVRQDARVGSPLNKGRGEKIKRGCKTRKRWEM